MHLLGDFTFACGTSRANVFLRARSSGRQAALLRAAGTDVVLSNTLDCIRLHPEVSRDLNDLAIADFLAVRRQPGHDTTSSVTSSDCRQLIA